MHAKPDSVPRRRGDVRRASSSRWRWPRGSRSSTRCSSTTPKPSGCCSPPRSCSWSFVIDDFRDVSPPAKIAGQVLSGSVLSLLRRHDALLPRPVRELRVRRALDRPRAARHRAHRRGAGERDEPHRRDRRPRRGRRAHRRGRRSSSTPTGCSKPGCWKARTSPRSSPRSPWAVCAGFLPHNFSPARIIMGDAGAMLLGLFLATMTITIGGRTTDPFSGQTYFYFAPLLIPLVILGVPIVDAAFAFVRRVVRRQHFAEADREHLHHRLVRMGHGPRRAVDDPLALDRAALRGRAAPDLHRPRQHARRARGGRARPPPLHLLPSRRPQCPPGGGALEAEARRPKAPNPSSSSRSTAGSGLAVEAFRQLESSGRRTRSGCISRTRPVV